MAEDQKRKQAREQVSKLRRFYTHLAIYLVVIVLLFFIDYSDGGNWWFYYVAIGWGAAVLIQGLSIVVFNPQWEEKKVQELVDKDSS